MSTARVRATTQLREKPMPNAQNTETLQAGTQVEIIKDEGMWLHVEASHNSHAIPGWAQREAFTFPPVQDSVLSSMLYSAKANEALAWKKNAALDKPSWIPEFRWGKIGVGGQQTIKDAILGLFQNHQEEWDAWLASREDEALMEEWLATLQGGRDVWAVRAEQIYPDAAEKNGVGWVNVNDIMGWTGKVKRNDQETKYKIWYEVSLYKSGKMLKGWFKGVLIEPYVYPTEANDTAIDANKDSQFDLTKPLLRHPADTEIDDALKANRSGLQYIDIIKVLGRSKIHHNLCGEFCAAALAGVDVIPFLNKWKAADTKVEKILRDDIGTGLGDVKNMLSSHQLKFEEFRYTPSITPVSPSRLLKLLGEGKMVFWGVAIFKSNGKLAGTLSNDKTTRHWIVLEDVIPVGNSGWVRIYNPFRNREEVYEYNVFMQSVGQFGIGLLVDVS